MKKILFLLSLFICIQVSGQYPGIVAASNRVTVSDGEMLTNGALTSGTAWTVTGGWTLASNAATFDDVTNGLLNQFPASMVTNVVANTAYTLTFDVSGASGGGVYIKITSTDNGDGDVQYSAYAEYTNGTKTVNFTTPADVFGGGIRFQASTLGDSGATIDNISLKLTP